MNEGTESVDLRVNDTPPPLVHIVWEDAAHEFGWIDNPDIGDVTCHSVGWLLKMTKKNILISQSWSSNQVAQTLQLPRKMVIEINYIKAPTAEAN
jgi:hypothetical protein